jgi:hypothetical protein
MAEVGYDIRERMELFVPPTNRLLAAFLMGKDMPLFATKGGAPPALTRYAMVQVPRQAEYLDARPTDFAKVVEGVKQQFVGANADATFQSAEEEITRRLKSLNVDKAVSLGKPEMLGTFFSKPDAYGFGMVSPVSVGTNTMKLAMGGAVVRIAKDECREEHQMALTKRVKDSKEIKIERPPRAKLSAEDSLKRMQEFDKRRERFIASIRKSKG